MFDRASPVGALRLAAALARRAAARAVSRPGRAGDAAEAARLAREAAGPWRAAAAERAAARATRPARSLSVASWNVFLRPAGLFRDGQGRRARRVPGVVRGLRGGGGGVDAVVFSELHDGEHVAEVARGLAAAGLVHRSRRLMQQEHRATAVCGGVRVFSRWRIAAESHLQFRAACGADRLAAKGAVVCRIERPGAPFALVGTHLQSGSRRRHREVRAEQAAQLRRALDVLVGGSGRVPVVVAGDLNEPPAAAAGVVGAVGGVMPASFAGAPHTVNPAGSPLAGAERVLGPCRGCCCAAGAGAAAGGPPRRAAPCDEASPAWVDYVFHLGAHAPPSRAPELVCDPAAPRDVSDHLPVVATFEFD